MWNNKPDRYPIPVWNPMGMGTDTCMNFYPWVWVWVWISTRSLFTGGWVIDLPDPNPTHCHPYARWTSWQRRWPVFSSHCGLVADLKSSYSLCRCDCLVPDLVKIVAGESQYCSWAAGSKARVYLVLILLLWWVLNHAHKVFDEMSMRQ
jgi:hypothetical protein